MMSRAVSICFLCALFSLAINAQKPAIEFKDGRLKIDVHLLGNARNNTQEIDLLMQKAIRTVAGVQELSRVNQIAILNLQTEDDYSCAELLLRRISPKLLQFVKHFVLSVRRPHEAGEALLLQRMDVVVRYMAKGGTTAVRFAPGYQMLENQWNAFKRRVRGIDTMGNDELTVIVAAYERLIRNNQIAFSLSGKERKNRIAVIDARTLTDEAVADFKTVAPLLQVNGVTIEGDAEHAKWIVHVIAAHRRTRFSTMCIQIRGIGRFTWHRDYQTLASYSANTLPGWARFSQDGGLATGSLLIRLESAFSDSEMYECLLDAFGDVDFLDVAYAGPQTVAEMEIIADRVSRRYRGYTLASHSHFPGVHETEPVSAKK